MGFGKRTEIPRCQYGVYSPSIHGDEGECGMPSVAIWDWGNGKPLYVCEDHDDIVQEFEERVEEVMEIVENEMQKNIQNIRVF